MADIAKDRLPWFPCFQSKLLGALAGMPPDCGYVYVVVLLRTYEVEGACPDLTAVLSRRTGLTVRRVEMAVEWLVEQGKLTRTGAGLANPFAIDVLNGRNERHNCLSRAGKRGGEKTANKNKQNQQNGGSQATSQGQAKGKPASSILDLDLDSESKKESKKELSRYRGCACQGRLAKRFPGAILDRLSAPHRKKGGDDKTRGHPEIRDGAVGDIYRWREPLSGAGRRIRGAIYQTSDHVAEPRLLG